MLKKKKTLILYHSNTNYFYNQIKPIGKLFKSYHILNYQDYFNNYGDLFLKKKILNYIYSQNVNTIIIFCHNDNFQISLSFLKKIKRKVKIIFIFKDDDTNVFVYSRYYAMFSDAIITNSKFANSYYKSLKLNSFLCTDSFPQKKLIKKKYKYDVSFVGSFLKNGRNEYIEYIKNNSKLKYFFLDTSKDAKKISDKKYNQIIRTTKINLNFTSAGSKNYKFFENFDPFINNSFGFKGRIIEVGLNKSFLLSEHFGEWNYFWKKKEIVIFYNKEDMLNKIHFYLKNENERKLISENLFKKCKLENTPTNFNMKLFNKIFYSFKEKTYFTSNENNINLCHFKRLEATFLLLYVLKMLKNFKFKSIIFTLNRFFSLNLIDIFYSPIYLARYLYYFFFK